jgi:uncharacterized membrane protein YkoI
VRLLLFISVLLGTLAILAPRAFAAEATCYSDWSEAALIVEKEGLVSVETLTSAARSKVKGDILKTTLCKQNGGYVYRLVVRGANGQLSPLTVDAKNPFTD